MEPIVVSRIKLIHIIDGNRARHIDSHLKAVAGWKVKQIDAIKKAAAKAMKLARAGRHAPMHVNLPEPVSYVKEYDRVLGMLRMDTSPSIKLDAADYDRYVKDRWEWAESFANSTLAYSNVAKRLRKAR
jgi:hypothetical protein